MEPVRIAAALMMLAGGAVTAMAALHFARLLRQTSRESYEPSPPGRAFWVFSLCVMLLLALGGVAGAVYGFFYGIEPFFLFAAAAGLGQGLLLEAMVRVQAAMLRSLRGKAMEVMQGFVNSIEMKDPYIQGHSWHVYYLVQALLRHLPAQTRQSLNPPKLLEAALLHDIGKMSVPDGVLGKKGALSEAEWAFIKAHPRCGMQMLENTCFAEIGGWVLYHHERMDGKGYHGLPGADVPLEARIIALADTYSAVSTSREYRPKRSHAEALDVLREVAGSQLDAELVEVFCAIPEEELAGLIAKALGKTRAAVG